MTEPNAAKAEALAHLQAVVNDPAADPAQRIKVATTLAQLQNYTLSGKGNGHAVSAPKELGDLVSLVTQLVEQHVALKRMVLDREKRITELEARLIQLEQQPTPKYLGVWSAEKLYHIGDFVTDHGAVWHCNHAATGVRPGGGEGVWTLAVQRGKPAKERR